MSNRSVEKNAFMTPDSLRQFLKLNKGIYDLHTSKNYGLDDTGGLKYVGTVENYGSELLIESNKLKLNRPPIESLLIDDSLLFYFDLKFSEDITDFANCFIYESDNNFNKQNMVCGLLKKDRLINDHTYSIIYDDIELVYSLNSYAVSDNKVSRMAYFRTTTAPVLRIMDENESITEIPLTVSDGSEVDTVYYFPLNLMTYDLIMQHPFDTEINDIVTAGTFTININDNLHDHIPYIWFCVDRFKKLPSFELINDKGYGNRTLLSVGMDGHNIVHLYPSCDTEPCIPNIPSVEGEWYLKAIGEFTVNGRHDIVGDVLKIQYMYSTDIDEEAIYHQDITYDFTLHKVKVNPTLNWYIHRNNEDVIDFLYLPLTAFDQNIPSDIIINNEVELIPAFDVKMDDRKYIDYFEPDMVHLTSGIHVDYTTDYSENGVKKLRGVVHDMGEFDGLPSYYKEWMMETHRSHVEMYSIRDNIINNNNPMNRQTAGVIIDSGVPQIDIESMGMNAEVCISYIGDSIFDTIKESESSTNYLTDLGYHDDQTFACTIIGEYSQDQKFIYHGNGIFSLGVQELDPELEMGRVYGITNDSIKYENNGLTENRAARTVARICDIPTSFVQLINIKDYSPTYALDPYYVSQRASWNIAQEIMLWNIDNPRFICYNNTRIFDKDYDLDSIPVEFLENNYSQMGNFNNTLDMSDPEHSTDFTFTIYASGTGYEVDDEFNAIIGGVNFRGEVTGIDSGHVTSIHMFENTNTEVNIGNITPNPMRCKTTNISSEGSGLVLTLTIDSDVWDSLHITKIGLFPDLSALKFDSFGRVWVYRYDEIENHWYKYTILIGENVEYNFYDEENPISQLTPERRPLKDVYFYNIFQSKVNPSSNSSKETKPNAISSEYSLTSDLSQYIINEDETIYVPFQGTNPNYDIREYHQNSSIDYAGINKTCRDLLPQYHQANTFFAYNPSVKLTFKNMDNIQPTIQIYSPSNNVTYDISQNVYNEFLIEEKHNSTLSDILESQYIVGNKLQENVYSFSFMHDVDTHNDRINELSNMSREELIDIISTNYPESEPIEMEGSTGQYTIDQLVDYIIQHESIKRSDVKLIAHKYDNPNNITKYGGYMRAKNKYHKYVYTESTQIEAYPTTFFKLDNFNQDLTNFRMYDDIGNDVSEYCVLLINKKLYAFVNNSWIQINYKGE